MKFALGAVVVVLAASLGTLGVAYYSDSVVFDSGPAGTCCKVSHVSESGCCPFSIGTTCSASASDGDSVCPLEASVRTAESALKSSEN
jgi:hypothetical protein